jgi:hypothetical protein
MKGMIMNAIVTVIAPLLRRFGLLTQADVHAEAERLLEEERWKIEASLEAERLSLEHERQALEYDRLAISSYAVSIGVPLLDERALH